MKLPALGIGDAGKQEHRKPIARNQGPERPRLGQSLRCAIGNFPRRRRQSFAGPAGKDMVLLDPVLREKLTGQTDPAAPGKPGNITEMADHGMGDTDLLRGLHGVRRQNTNRRKGDPR